jgi:hypothetical protein
MADPLAEMARIRVVHTLNQPEGSNSLAGTVEELLDQSLDENPTGWSEATRNVMRGVVEGLSDRADATQRIRAASETAVLTVAKRWGNIVSAGKATVTATREACGKTGLDSTLCAQQASLGAMEGALQAGPIVYPLLRKELTPIVEDFEKVLHKERRNFHVDREPADGPQVIDYNPTDDAPAPVEAAVIEVVAPAPEPVSPAIAPEEPAPVPHLSPPKVGEAKIIKPPEKERPKVQQAILEATRPIKPTFWQSVKSWFSGLFSKGK